MPTLYITEYATPRNVRGSSLGLMEDQPIAEQTVAIGGASAQSANLNAKTRFVRLHADAICSVAVGANPTATATTRRMAAGQTERFAVRPEAVAAGLKIAAITNT